jgi:hypothetical protein
MGEGQATEQDVQKMSHAQLIWPKASAALDYEAQSQTKCSPDYSRSSSALLIRVVYRAASDKQAESLLKDVVAAASGVFKATYLGCSPPEARL